MDTWRGVMLIKTSLVHNKQCRPRRLFPNLGHLSSDVGCWTARKQASIERKNPPGWQSSYARLTAKTEHRRDLEANQPNAMHRTTRTTNRARQLGHATTDLVRLTHRFWCVTSAGRPLLSQPIDFRNCFHQSHRISTHPPVAGARRALVKLFVRGQ